MVRSEPGGSAGAFAGSGAPGRRRTDQASDRELPADDGERHDRAPECAMHDRPPLHGTVQPNAVQPVGRVVVRGFLFGRAIVSICA
jgi:hypothetical protein